MEWHRDFAHVSDKEIKDMIKECEDDSNPSSPAIVGISTGNIFIDIDSIFPDKWHVVRKCADAYVPMSEKAKKKYYKEE